MGKYHSVFMDNLPKPLSDEDTESALIRLKLHNDLTAKNLLIEHNLRLVKFKANRFQNTKAEFDDLFSIGVIGLMKGIDTFDIDKGIKLATYISRCIDNEMLMYLRGMKKHSNDVSFEGPLSIDTEGHTFAISDTLSSPEAEEAMYRVLEEADHTLIPIVLSLPNSLQNLSVVLYWMSGMTQPDIGKQASLSQSYISRILKSFSKEAKEVYQSSDEYLKLLYSSSQSDERDFIFSIDNQHRFCLSIHSKFFDSFIEFMMTHDNEFETLHHRIIFRLPMNESSCFFYAELILYLSKHVCKLNILDLF